MKLTAWERFPYPVRKAWRIMRVTTLLILVISLHLSAKTTAQKITLSSNNISIEQFFNQLEKQTGYSFLLENGVVSKDEKISVNVKDALLETVLDQILKPINLSYKIENKTVYVKKVKEVAIFPTLDDAPPGDIHGRVTDSLGNPLAGASITVKGSKKGIQTNANGEFDLKDVNDNSTLIISFTGYTHQEIKLNGQNTISIKLNHSNNPLDQVQIIAYGTTTQRLTTGDISTVTSKEIEQQPVSNPLAALEGRVPGLVVTQTTGAPGGGFTVQIRGQSSILNGNDPFYVIDGVPYPSETLGLINGTLQNGNPLNFINVADIENITVLKDADATSIYGSRAANGAILITTKKGKAGKMKIDINAYSGVGKLTREYHVMNTQQYLQMRHEAFYNDSVVNPSGYIPPNLSNAPDLVLWDTTRYTDWQKVLLGNAAHYSDVQVSASGGTNNTQYLVGAGYHRETTVFPVVLPGQGADQKVSVHFNLLSTSDDKRFKLNLSASYISDLNTVQPNDFTGIAATLPPDGPTLFNPDGSLNWEPAVPGQQGTWANPYGSLYQTYNGNTSNLVSNALISYTILNGLEVRTSFGYTFTQTNEIETNPTTSFDPYSGSSSSSAFNATNTHSWIIEPQADYHLNLGKAKFTALAGSTFQENNTAAQNISAYGFISDALLENLQSASSSSTISTSAQYRYTALFGRLNLNWADKFLLNFTGRRDGSSRFGPGKQFANFGSVGAAWIFSEEDFIKKNLSFLSFGKVRGSYGTSGNDQIGDYRYLDLYNTTYYPYQGIQGLFPGNLYNPNLAWELDKKLEGGIELGFLKDRVTLNVSYFRNRSGNQLISTPVSGVTGFNSIPENLPALVQNSGIEMTLNTINIKAKNFTWKSSINLTIPSNKLISFPDLINSPYSNSFIVGQSITINKVFHLLGVNDTTGIYQFATIKGTSTYTPTYNVDNTVVINLAPKIYGGFQNSFQYKGISVDFLFQFVEQTGKNIFYSLSTMPGTKFNEPEIVLNRWQKTGDEKPYQQYSQNYSGEAYQVYSAYTSASNFDYSDASFVRLKNLSISYIIPQHWLEKEHIKAIRIYLQGQNLWTITKYTGNDPESQGSGLPPLRVFTAGFQVTL